MVPDASTIFGSSQAGGDCPLIVTASRATDLPAWHAEWLRERLRQGYAERRNPFNGRWSRIHFYRTRVFVFWSKNPAPLIPFLEEWETRGIGTIVHFTLNDYEREGWEPGVPPLDKRIHTFEALSERLGKGRVIWRFDPLIRSDRLPLEALIERIARIAEWLKGRTEKMVFSFVDLACYRRVRRRLARVDPSVREFTEEEIFEMAAALASLNRAWGFELAACTETADLTPWGIAPNRCVDDVLLRRLFPDDRILMEGLGPPGSPPKDRGQRAACRCIPSRDIGSYGTCRHGCLYCYAQ